MHQYTASSDVLFQFTNAGVPFQFTDDNGFNPYWCESCEFDIGNPDIALIRFAVYDEDYFGDPNFLGQATYPVSCLRVGYRSIQLKNTCSDEMEMASLLVLLELITVDVS